MIRRMKISKAVLDRVDELIASMKANRPNAADQAEAFVRHLQSEAYYARLDGRSARCRELNRVADRLARARNDLRAAAA